MSHLNNFRTIFYNQSKKDYSIISFSDTKIYPIAHFPSCPNLRHPVPEKISIAEYIIKEASEARIRLDHIDEEILINNDKLITSVELDQVDMEDTAWEKLKTEISGAPKVPVKIMKKNTKDKSPLRKTKACKSLDASPLRFTKKVTPVRMKKTNPNIKVKNINKFINKPKNKTSSATLQMGTMSKTSLLRKPTYTHTRSTSVSTQNNKTMNRTNYSVEKIVRPFNNKTPKTTKNIIHFGSSAIRNHEKTFTELQSLFGQKLDNVDNKYNDLSEVDKKTLISTLLGIVYELKTEAKISKTKCDSMKKEIESNKKMMNSTNKEVTKLKEQLKKAEKANQSIKSSTIKKPVYTKHNRTHSVEITKNNM